MDNEFEEELLSAGGQESPQDKWLTNEEYASGKWWRYALERLMAVLLATRFTTSMLEFVARAGFMMYVPVWCWQLRMVNTNPLADDPEAFMILTDDEGQVILGQDHRPIVKQGPDFIPAFLAGVEFKVNGKKAWSSRLFNAVINHVRDFAFFWVKIDPKAKFREKWQLLIGEELFSPGQNRIRFKVIIEGEELLLYIHESHLQRVRYWVPTPILAQGLPQAPRLPFEMMPKWHLERAYNQELFKRAMLVLGAAIRNATTLAGQGYDGLSDEFVEWQYCGASVFHQNTLKVSWLDEELLRFYKHGKAAKFAPRVHKLSPYLQSLAQAGVTLWKVEGGKILIPRWLENEASITERVHREVGNLYVTAEQVYSGMEETKRRVGFEVDPANVLPVIQSQTILGGWGDLNTLSDDRKLLVIKYYLTYLANNGREVEAAGYQDKIRSYLEDWIEDNYELKQPNLQYHFRKYYYDLHQIHTDSWATLANRWFNLMKLRIHMINAPRVISSTQQWADFLELVLFMADFESWRNLEHMQAHWQSIKTLLNESATEVATDSAILGLRARDLGGIWQPRQAGKIWRFNKMDEAAPKPVPGDSRDVRRAKLARRRWLFGPAWQNKEAWETVDHDGVMAVKFAGKRNGWSTSTAGLKGFSSDAGTSAFKNREKLEDEIRKFRDYQNEYYALLYDEYYGYDPVDAVEHMKAFVTFSAMHDTNARWEGRFRHFPGFRLTWDNCFQFQTLIERMWKILPPGPRVKAVEGKIKELLHHNEDHLRPEIDKQMDGIYRSYGRYGLNKYFTGYYRRRGQEHIKVEEDKDLLLINRKPIATTSNNLVVYERKAFERDWEWVKGWYERSDDRLNDFVYWWCEAGSTKGKHGASGAGGFDVKIASGHNDHAYGLGYGTLAEQQERQERHLEVGLQVGYYTVMKHTLQWLSVRMTAIELMPDVDEHGIKVNKTWVTLNELKLKVGGLIEHGSILYFIARDELWPRIQTMSPRIANEPFPFEDTEPANMDDQFVMRVLDYMVGVDSRPRRNKILKSQAPKEEIEPIFEENHERYGRIVEGRFFGINHLQK